MNICHKRPRETVFVETKSQGLAIEEGTLQDVYANQKQAFGAAVRAARKRKFMSQESLAERAILHRTYITDIERGARNLSLETICKLANALGVSVVSLFAHMERRHG